MPMSSLEVATQTMASVLSGYLEEVKSVPVFPKDGLSQLVKEQFPHCEKVNLGSRLGQTGPQERQMGPPGGAAVCRGDGEVKRCAEPWQPAPEKRRLEARATAGVESP
ncbi:UNVERIFIED_CONTAM: hypothetical protein K2H54_025491 [Gekko kuhli]